MVMAVILYFMVTVTQNVKTLLTPGSLRGD